ncbi:MAG TPA: hypothetical protein VNY31_06165 [Solirubrobacteraceae bacterium]|jgi:hypothetical protein|nr:hypothetical protein [Solirubrobacteraceae bacterium]
MSEIHDRPPDQPPPPEKPEGSDDTPQENAFADVSREEWAEWENRVPSEFSPSDQAAARQPDAEDQWADRTAGEGEQVWMAPYDDGKHSGFGVMEGGLNDVAYDGAAYRQGVQMGRQPERLECYELQRPYEIAVAPTEANTQYGDGGIEQAYIPDVDKRIEDGTLKLLGSYDFDPRRS